MRIGFMGAGKLGLPCALAIESKGHDVVINDLNPNVEAILTTKILPYMEARAQTLLQKTKIKHVSLADLVKHSNIIFVAIQTPHDPAFEGVTLLSTERKDFDYSYLKAGITALIEEIRLQRKHCIVAIISTVLPGTIRREIMPLMYDVNFVYNPAFVAMGTVVEDFLHPEFVLVGVTEEIAASMINVFYQTIHRAYRYFCRIEEAELIKVAYNTYIGQKLVFANNLMEICHKMGMSVDAVTAPLTFATDRLLSPKYLSAGMGDGGSCHPRDAIAMSWLSRELKLSFDWSEAVMVAREKQTNWLADLVEEYKIKTDLPIIILGTAFKPESNIEDGSPGLLLRNILINRGYDVWTFDPYTGIHVGKKLPTNFARAPAIFFVATKHAIFQQYWFPKGSVVLDPWRYIPLQTEVTVVPIGGLLTT